MTTQIRRMMIGAAFAVLTIATTAFAVSPPPASPHVTLAKMSVPTAPAGSFGAQQATVEGNNPISMLIVPEVTINISDDAQGIIGSDDANATIDDNSADPASYANYSSKIDHATKLATTARAAPTLNTGAVSTAGKYASYATTAAGTLDFKIEDQFSATARGAPITTSLKATMAGTSSATTTTLRRDLRRTTSSARSLPLRN